MEDRYLFKAKTAKIVDTYNNGVEDGVWVHGSLRCDVGKYTIFQFETERADYVEYEIDPTTICQCTGLTDKNGNLIWENDIVEFQFDNEDCPLPNKDTKKRKGKVFFSDYRASFSITMGRRGSKSLNNDLFKYIQCGNRVKVIGNIFDDSELLESKE